MSETNATGSGSTGSNVLKILGIGCGGCLLLIVVAGVVLFSMLPSEWHVERSITIDAPVEEVFPLVNSPANWPQWDPWSPLDPDMEREYKGPPAGVGAESHWDSTTDDVGAGMFRITESVVGQRVVIALEFTRPFESKSTGTFTFEERGDGVHVTWADDAQLEGMMRFMGFAADALLGPAFEEGLGNLKELAEGDADADGGAGDDGGNDGDGE